MKLSFIQLIRFRDDYTRIFQQVSINLNMTVGQAACRLLLRPVFAESYRFYVWIRRKNLWLFVLEMHLISDVTDWAAGVQTAPSGKLNVQNRPPPSPYIDVYYSFGLQ